MTVGAHLPYKQRSTVQGEQMYKEHKVSVGIPTERGVLKYFRLQKVFDA